MNKIGLTIEVIHGLDEVNPNDDNVDIVVTLSDGRRFSGTFFTLKNVETLMKRWKESGECLNGLYFFTPDCVIVKKLTQEIVEATVRDMIKNEFFGSLIELKD